MTSSLVNLILFVALVITSICVAAMYFKLKRFENHHAEYNRAFAKTSEALSKAGDAIRILNQDGQQILLSLEQRIEEAREMIRALESIRSAAEGRPSHLEQRTSK